MFCFFLFLLNITNSFIRWIVFLFILWLFGFLLWLFPSFCLLFHQSIPKVQRVIRLLSSSPSSQSSRTISSLLYSFSILKTDSPQISIFSSWNFSTSFHLVKPFRSNFLLLFFNHQWQKKINRTKMCNIVRTLSMVSAVSIKQNSYWLLFCEPQERVNGQ